MIYTSIFLYATIFEFIFVLIMIFYFNWFNIYIVCVCVCLQDFTSHFCELFYVLRIYFNFYINLIYLKMFSIKMYKYLESEIKF